MANILTVIRIIGIFPLFISLINNGPTIYNFLIFAFLGFTDFLDGYIARKYNKVTNFGKIADGIADKLLMFSMTLALLITNTIPIWSLIIFFREIMALIYGALYIKGNKKVSNANIFGKAKTTLHIISIALVLLIGKWNIVSAILLILAILLFIPECIFVLKNQSLNLSKKTA